jgi:hypothetical protein
VAAANVEAATDAPATAGVTTMAYRNMPPMIGRAPAYGERFSNTGREALSDATGR